MAEFKRFKPNRRDMGSREDPFPRDRERRSHRSDESPRDRRFSRDVESPRDRRFSRDDNRFQERRQTTDFRREMFEVTCAKCGKDCQVPFKPTGNKPVFCSDCFRKNEVSARKESDQSLAPELEKINQKLDKIMRILNME